MVTPAPAGTGSGNRTTALRWARLLRALGHRVTVGSEWNGRPADVLVALHALKSRDAVLAFQLKYPRRPVVVALTGTDLYDAMRVSEEARDTVRRACRLVVLQPCALDELPESVRPRARVIFQSASAPADAGRQLRTVFEVCVVAGLRSVKDPLLCARAARLLPAHSRIRVEHFGAPLDPELEEDARRESRENPRYRWHGDRPHPAVLRRLARSRLLVLTSRLEGGANAVSEALAAEVPVIATRIPGTVGILGADYEGYFAVGDAAQLSLLLARAESDTAWYERLREQVRARRCIVDPAREREDLRRLLEEVASSCGSTAETG